MLPSRLVTASLVLAMVCLFGAEAQGNGEGLSHPFPDSEWSDWTPCSSFCGQGWQGRHNCGPSYRLPPLNGNGLIRLPSPDCYFLMASCVQSPCMEPLDWQPFGPCSVPCGGGFRNRTTGPNCIRDRCPFQQEIPCHRQSCSPLEGCGGADIVFLLDSSLSMGEYAFSNSKQLVNDIIKALKSADGASVRIAVVTFSTTVEVNVDFAEYATTPDVDLENHIWGIPFMRDSTNTADGILRARMLFANEARSDVTKIMVVMTDGSSNIQRGLTVVQALKAREEGITTFSVGFTTPDEAELLDIAQDPDNVLTKFRALPTITDLATAGSCEPTTECGNWTEWSQCSATCDGGETSRSRQCARSLRGTVQSRWLEAENGTCNSQPCAGSEPDCSKCAYEGGYGYLPVPNNVCAFYMCQRIATGATTYRYTYTQRPCAAGTKWEQSILTCVHHSGECNSTYVAVTEKPFVCNMQAVEDETKYLETTSGIVMPCATGTVFDQVKCACIRGNNPGAPPCTGPLLYFPFDDHFKSEGCEKVEAVKEGVVSFSWDAKKSKSAQFAGNGVLLVSFLKNYFANNNVQAFTVALWFKWTASPPTLQGLVNSGNCETGRSFDIWVGTGSSLSASLYADNQVTKTTPVLRWDWTHVAEVYDGANLKLYINGVLKSTTPLTGPISNGHCSMMIGQRGEEGAGHLDGNIDELKVFTSALSAQDVQGLMT